MLIRFLFLLTLLFIGNVKADDSPIEAMGVHLFSRHDPYKGENQYNPGLFVRFRHGIQVGQYTNSFGRETNYVGLASPEWYRLRVTVLAATGYKQKGAVIVPIPSVKLYEFDNGPSVWLSGTPFQITDSRAVGHLHVEWKY